MLVTAILAASLAAPVPKALVKPKSVEQQLLGLWEYAGTWKRLPDATADTVEHSGWGFEFRPDGVAVQLQGPKLPAVEMRYTLVEPDDRYKEWRVRFESPKPDGGGKWHLMEVTDGRLKVIDGMRGSKDVYLRVKVTPADGPKK